MAKSSTKSTVLLKDVNFDPAIALAKFNREHVAGAIASFSGWVRGSDHAGNTIESLRIEHYPGMTEKSLASIAERTSAKFQLMATLIIHRWGVLTVDEPIVLVATAASHRGEAFDGCRMIMDFLKTEAPFWKQEIGPAGANWVQSRVSDAKAVETWQT